MADSYKQNGLVKEAIYKSICYVIPCVSSRKPGKSNLCSQKSGEWLLTAGGQWLPGVAWGSFWYASNILFLDLGDGYKNEFKFMKIHPAT